MNAPAGPRIARLTARISHPHSDDASSRVDDVPNRVVLICTSDPLETALLAAAAELEGQRPIFPHPDEPARAALVRLRPPLVLIDCDYPDACDDAFLGPATMLGTRVVIVRSPRSRIDPTPVALRHGLAVLNLPADHDRIPDAFRTVSV